MRPVRYNVAASLDGFIAGPGGEYDWIGDEPEIDFEGLFSPVDTVLLGRRTYELVLAHPEVPTAWRKGSRLYVFSRTLRQEDHPGVTVVGDDAAAVVAALRAEPGDGEIWLFGGGDLFAHLLDAGQVDRVEVTIIPILLSGGVPLLPPTGTRQPLQLTWSRAFPSGQVSLHYEVTGARS